jgi:hypothetical protein
MTEKVDIRCILKGDAAHKFLAIWKEKGLENKTEVVRALIKDFCDAHPEVANCLKED